jgi:hypothetical protein
MGQGIPASPITLKPLAVGGEGGEGGAGARLLLCILSLQAHAGAAPPTGKGCGWG